MSEDVVLGKKDIVERCIRQIRAYYARPRTLPFAEDYLTQDAIALNLQRACQACIDLANHVIKRRKLGLPKESRDSFRLLAEGGVINAELSRKLQGMVGFRNVLVHEYQKVDIALMVDVIENRLPDLLALVDAVVFELNQISEEN